MNSGLGVRPVLTWNGQSSALKANQLYVLTSWRSMLDTF